MIDLISQFSCGLMEKLFIQNCKYVFYTTTSLLGRRYKAIAEIGHYDMKQLFIVFLKMFILNVNLYKLAKQHNDKISDML